MNPSSATCIWDAFGDFVCPNRSMKLDQKDKGPRTQRESYGSEDAYPYTRTTPSAALGGFGGLDDPRMKPVVKSDDPVSSDSSSSKSSAMRMKTASTSESFCGCGK
jgi:hypothetical protein